MSSDIHSSDSVLSLYVQNRPVPHDTRHTTQHSLNILLLLLFTRYISRIIQSCICALCHFMTADIVYCSYFLYGVRATDHCYSVRVFGWNAGVSLHVDTYHVGFFLSCSGQHSDTLRSRSAVKMLTTWTLHCYFMKGFYWYLVFLYYVLHKLPQFLYTAAEIMTSPLLSLNWTWWEHWFSFFMGYRV